jgi:hypothetical protein
MNLLHNVNDPRIVLYQFVFLVLIQNPKMKNDIFGVFNKYSPNCQHIEFFCQSYLSLKKSI